MTGREQGGSAVIPEETHGDGDGDGDAGKSRHGNAKP